MHFTIRGYRTGDASALIEVFERSVAGLAPAKYSDMQVAAWLSGTRDARTWHARIHPREAYVAEGTHGRLLGWIEMELDGHLDFLYCVPEAARTGIADTLYAVLVAGARKLGVKRLHTEASTLAESFFLRHGWSLDARETITRAGVAIPRARMSYRIPGD